MTLPTSRFFSKDPEQLANNLQDMYADIVRNLNGDIKIWTPTISGATGAGAGTYTTQSGLYLRQGLITDVWYYVVWSAHTGTGNMILNLPLKVKLTVRDYFTEAVEITGINLSANYTYAMARCSSNSLKCAMIEVGDDVTPQNIAMDGVAGLRGHLRYIGQVGA